MGDINYYEILTKMAIKEAITYCYKELKKYLTVINRELTLNQEDFQKSFEFVINDAVLWSSEIKPFGYFKSRSTIDHYIELDYFLTPQKFQYKIEETQNKLLSTLIKTSDKNLVIFGKPGMGKTTSMKMLVQKILLDEEYLPDNFQIPIVIRLRELKEQFSENELKGHEHRIIYLFIYKLLNLNVSTIGELRLSGIEKEQVIKNLVLRIIEQLKVTLILDGFDELNSELRGPLISQVKEISLKSKSSKIILTSRSGEFNYAIHGFEYFEIAPLRKKQIIIFTLKWFQNDKESKQFLLNLKNSPFSDTAIKPLILSFLCTIFEQSGSLPNKPKFLFQEIIDLLIVRWDKERGFMRRSKFKGFDKNAKLDFMINLAFELVMKSLFNFSKHDLKQVFLKYHSIFGLPKDSFLDVIEEIEEHSGLFIQSGVDKFEFPHKSIQEFLASEYLVRYSPLEDFTPNIVNIPNELAIVVSLSKNTNNKLVEILGLINGRSIMQIQIFLSSFLHRLNSESPVFMEILNTPIFLSIFWKKLFILKDKRNLTEKNIYEFADIVYGFTGINGCYVKLEAFYKVPPILIKNLMKGKSIPEKEELIDLEPRQMIDKLEPLSVHFKFLENWTYISPYIKRN